MQIRELEQLAKLRDWKLFDVYSDADSGAKDQRPELDRLMRDAMHRRFDVVLVWKLDRFGRSLRHLVNALAELQAWGVQFVSKTDNLDLTTPSGRLMFHVIAAMAEFERDLIRERVRSGIAAARAKGIRLGRPRVIADVNLIAQLRRQGASWQTVAKRVGVGVGTCRRRFPRRAKKGRKSASKKGR